MKNLVEKQMNNVSQFAKKNWRVIKKQRKSNLITKRDSNSFFNLYQKTFDLTNFDSVWKPAAIECLNHMQNVTKGSLCALCDEKEYKRFLISMYKDPKTGEKVAQVQVNVNDIYAFANKCRKYIWENHKLFYLFKDMTKMLHYLVPASKKTVKQPKTLRYKK